VSDLQRQAQGRIAAKWDRYERFFTSVFLLSGRVLGLLQDGLAVGASFF
jgi:hypothetical protein